MLAVAGGAQCLSDGWDYPSTMRVLATVGLPGSGKGEAANVARELDVPVVTMGDVIRAECRDRGLDPATEHGRVATALREENGPAAIAERSLPLIEDELASSDAVLVDGVRSDVEVDAFEAAFGASFSLVSIEAPFEVRKARLAERGRDGDRDDGGESLEERDERERGFGMDAAMERADVHIDNTDSLEAFQSKVRTLLVDGIDAYRSQYDAAEGDA
ncbi:Dephospho-CoA kinase [Halomicrobium sp. LC1Hm]|nr:Dephospho-CoA kinase [Halomicrobium sp. LC1Hm]